MAEKPLEHIPDKESFKEGLVQIFTGDGKGKTSAALGTVVRALGQDLKVCIIVFMKGNYPYSEWTFLSRITGVRIERFGTNKFTDRENPGSEAIEEAEKALAAARQAMLSGEYNVLVMDEVNIASAWKLVDVEEVVKLIEEKPRGVELILTGRYADDRLIKLADMVTECLKIKHPYDEGIKARKGLDY
ncbi:cob(I)yrinic acid a,c-diamide adenosyltransferase [Chloroflexota bacterium]